MAIKISGSTIIDDGRSLVNVGVSTISGDLHVGTGVTVFSSTGIVSATAYHHSDGTFLALREDGQENLLAGCNAGASISGSNSKRNILIGCNVACNSTFTSACDNIFIGTYAGSIDNVTGDSNTIIGNNAGRRITSGTRNIALGEGAGERITTGNCNVALGNGTISFVLSTGCFNTVVGQEAGLLNE